MEAVGSERDLRSEVGARYDLLRLRATDHGIQLARLSADRGERQEFETIGIKGGSMHYRQC